MKSEETQCLVDIVATLTNRHHVEWCRLGHLLEDAKTLKYFMSLRTDEQMNVLEGLLIGKTYGEIVPVQIEQIAKFLLVN
tara:strand:+ start:3288 stop:3527 length:240 start_codon:yes stop_codon:yes gene_type:complete